MVHVDDLHIDHNAGTDLLQGLRYPGNETLTALTPSLASPLTFSGDLSDSAPPPREDEILSAELRS